MNLALMSMLEFPISLGILWARIAIKVENIVIEFLLAKTTPTVSPSMIL